MKLLFLLYDFYPNLGSNSIIIHNLAKAFTESGHEVHVLPMKAYSVDMSYEIWNQIEIHRVTLTFDKHQISKYLHRGHLLKALRLIYAIRKDHKEKREYKKENWSYYPYFHFMKIMKQYNFDIVISVCYPFESSLPVMKYIKRFGKSFRWMIYMQDPFADNYYYLLKYPKEELLIHQSMIFSHADSIIVTPQIMEGLRNLINPTDEDKYRVLNFPKVMQPTLTNATDDIYFDRHYIHCVFVGKFNRDTRNPKLLFRLFEGLRNERIILHILGEERDHWEDYLCELSDNILFYGYKSMNACMNAELRANLLVNLGNSINNQLPSKILEYISTGKPIINLYKLHDCPCLKLLSKYPACLHIYEKQIDLYHMLRILKNYCVRYAKIHIPYSFIKERYYYYTVTYVSSEFLNLFDELMEDDR